MEVKMFSDKSNLNTDKNSPRNKSEEKSSNCCSTEEQQACCEPGDKATCCEQEGSIDNCGCM